MEYPLPQFLEIKPKIAGPLNFRQLAYVIAGSLVCLIFLFTQPLVQFILISIPIMAVSLILAFGKIKGFPIPTIMVRAFSFLFKPKIFMWQKTEHATPVLPTTKKPKKREMESDLAGLKIGEKSRLREIAKLIEIHPK